MCNRGVSEKKLKELEHYFDGYGSQHDKTILRLIKQYRRQKQAIKKMRVVPKTINSNSDHVKHMEGILCDLELGREL